MSEIDARSSEEIVARAGRYYRNTRYLLCVAFIAAGAWFAYDGWKGWPQKNIRFNELTAQLDRERDADPRDEAKIKSISDELSGLKHHTDSDILLQKRLAFILPAGGLAMLGWALYRSRGQYRLKDRVLQVPGHPPVPLDAITQVDKRLWDRKGIAHLDYELSGGQKGRITLDDFLYDRKPTDAIYDSVMKAVAPEEAQGAESVEEKSSDESGVR